MSGCKGEQMIFERARSAVDLCSTKYKIGAQLREAVGDWIDIHDIAHKAGLLPHAEVIEHLNAWEKAGLLETDRYEVDGLLVSVLVEAVDPNIWPSADDQIVEIDQAVGELERRGMDITPDAVERRSGWEASEVNRVLRQLVAAGLLERYSLDGGRAYRRPVAA